jgi:hypothetical protein
MKQIMKRETTTTITCFQVLDMINSHIADGGTVLQYYRDEDNPRIITSCEVRGNHPPLVAMWHTHRNDDCTYLSEREDDITQIENGDIEVYPVGDNNKLIVIKFLYHVPFAWGDESPAEYALRQAYPYPNVGADVWENCVGELRKAGVITSAQERRLLDEVEEAPPEPVTTNLFHAAPSSVALNVNSTMSLIKSGHPEYTASNKVIGVLKQVQGFMYANRVTLFEIYERDKRPAPEPTPEPAPEPAPDPVGNALRLQELNLKIAQMQEDSRVLNERRAAQRERNEAIKTLIFAADGIRGMIQEGYDAAAKLDNEFGDLCDSYDALCQMKRYYDSRILEEKIGKLS